MGVKGPLSLCVLWSFRALDTHGYAGHRSYGEDAKPDCVALARCPFCFTRLIVHYQVNLLVATVSLI